PSGDCLPENTLRFYIHFSAAMRSGSSQAHVSLVGPDGRSIEGAFLHLVTELWDPDMRRLTVLLHPGRIKRGVGANVAVGPALLAGQRYSIVVGNGMLDGSGRPLRQSFQKSFIAAPAVRRPIDPLQWTVSLPAPGTRQPLVLSFPNSLDHAILSHSLCVVGGTGEPMIGTVDIDASDRRWRFLPDTIWQSGPHQVLIDQRLEDVCGNTISAAFDIEGQVGGARARSRHPYALPFHLG
ncbi:MAG: hypothetical protein P4L98_15170, partial [Ancalomicrobiaceae bacterium]|nr:hypothetical protein [Ancalomicrobiaceae bacterium]